jgi:hypothetical protein
VTTKNDQLRAARENIPSPTYQGERLSCRELAALVNTPTGDPQSGYCYNDAFRRGQTVEWRPSAEELVNNLKKIGMPVGYPGIVSYPGSYSVFVRWVDKIGEYVHDGVFDQDWLRPVSQQEYEARAAALRASDWPGFSADKQN